jgi:hypothetical protein
MVSNQQTDLGPMVLFPLASSLGCSLPPFHSYLTPLNFTYFSQQDHPVHILSCLSVHVPIPGFYILLGDLNTLKQWYLVSNGLQHPWSLYCLLWIWILWLLCHNILHLYLISSAQGIQNMKHKQSIILGLPLQQEHSFLITSFSKIRHCINILNTLVTWFQNSEKLIIFCRLSLQEEQFFILSFL